MQGTHPVSSAGPEAYGGRIRQWREFEQTKLYDVLAAAPVILWFGVTIGTTFRALLPELYGIGFSTLTIPAAVGLLSRLGTIAFLALALILLVARRTPLAKAKGILPRLSAVAGTFLMTLIVWVKPVPVPVSVTFLSLLLEVGGLSFSIYSLSYLGRSFSLMPEARRLVTTGPYAAIRHPLYLGEAITMTGIVLQYLSAAGIAIFLVQFAFQLQRIKNEERILATLFPEYDAYTDRSARLIPGLY